MTAVYVVNVNTIWANGLAVAISSMDIEVVGFSGEIDYTAAGADVFIIDLDSPTQPISKTVEEIKALSPSCKTIGLSVNALSARELYLTRLDCAYLSSISIEELCKVMSIDIIPSKPPLTKQELLTERQYDVARCLIGHGLTLKTTAERLKISTTAVKKLREKAYSKIDLTIFAPED